MHTVLWLPLSRGLCAYSCPVCSPLRTVSASCAAPTVVGHCAGGRHSLPGGLGHGLPAPDGPSGFWDDSSLPALPSRVRSLVLPAWCTAHPLAWQGRPCVLFRAQRLGFPAQG